MRNKTKKQTKYIYVLLSRTHTTPARLIRFFTREPYSHASIALDIELNQLYSFARKHIHNPFDCGFIEENIETGIFGMDKNGNLLGGGESGSETVVGTKSLLRMIKMAVYEAVGPLVAASRELAKASAELGYVTYNGFTKLKEYRSRNDEDSQRDNNSGGDTFIFNSPKAIDEIEAAKLMKQTAQQMSMDMS